MNEVASLELCKELYELSGWDKHQTDDGYHFYMLYWEKLGTGEHTLLSRDDGLAWASSHDHVVCPAYSLSFLLRKIHDLRPPNRERTTALDWFGDDCEALSFGLTAHANTPEDAACELAIQLFNQGVLKRGES